VDDTMNLGGIKVSAVEIERVMQTLPELTETAAIAVEPQNRWPEPVDHVRCPRVRPDTQPAGAAAADASGVAPQLNPLFKIDELIFVDALPRTASNKLCAVFCESN